MLIKNDKIIARIDETGVTDGLVGWWGLDGNLKDKSGNGNHGTFPSGNPLYVDAIPDGGKGISFNGSYVSTVNKFSFNSTDSFSVSFWFKSTQNTTTVQEIIGKRRAVANSWSIWYRGSDGRCTFEINGNTAKRETAEDSGHLPNIWHFISAIYNGVVLRLYINGIQKSSTIYTDTGNFNNSNFLIGAQSTVPSSAYNGILDDVRIYNRALTDKEISQLYRSFKQNG